MGKDDARIPPTWPMDYNTKYNYSTPLKVEFNDEFNFNTYFSVVIRLNIIHLPTRKSILSQNK